MRETLTNILSEVGTSVRIIKSEKVLKLIADVIRFVLTLFVHEQSDEFRLLFTILDSSSHIYFIGSKKRKIYMYQVLQDHGIWSDIDNWRELVNYTIRFKIEDALRRKKLKKNETDKQISLKRFGEVIDKNLKVLMQTKDEKYQE